MKKLVRITSIPLSMEKLLGNQLRYMNDFYEVTAISSDEQKLKVVSENLGIKHFSVEMTRTISPLKDLVSICRMFFYFRKIKPDIVHSHTPKAGLVGMIAAYLAGVPVRLHTVAGLPLLESRGNKRILLSNVERLIYALATKIYPNSKELKRIILKEKFCRASKLKVLGNGSSNGIDTDYFDPQIISEEKKEDLRKELGLKKDDFVFIFLGRLVKDKGINELVSAFRTLAETPAVVEEENQSLNSLGAKIIPLIQAENSIGENKVSISRYNGSSITGFDIRHRLGKVLYKTASGSATISMTVEGEDSVNNVNGYKTTFSQAPVVLHPAYPHIKLLLVGPLEQELNPVLGLTLAEIQHNPQIISTGYVQDVRPYLALSECLVFPSYREGFPNAVLQAGAMSLPAIVTDINGCNEIITDGDNGVIIPVKNEKDLGAAMQKMMDHPELYKKMKSRSRKLVVERYSQQRVWDALINEYEKATEKIR